MAKFRIYNIQLLPQEEGVGEVGRAGYRKLFAEFRDMNRYHLSRKTQAQFHFALSSDSFLAPHKEFRFPSGYVYGNFLRYTTTEELTELQSGKTLYKPPRGKTAVASQKRFPFVFDTARHYLAVDGTALPKGDTFVQALTKFLEPVTKKFFPHHSLTINLISQANALEDILKSATAYRVVEVSLAFPNGHDTEKLLRELRDSKTQLNVRASAVGGQRGRMSSVPDFLKDMLRAAVTHGSAWMTYLRPPAPGQKTGRWETYNSADTPVTFSVRHSANDVDEAEFFERVHKKLAAIDIRDAVDDVEDQAAA